LVLIVIVPESFVLFIDLCVFLFFQSQLEQFEFEKQALLSENASTHNEVDICKLTLICE
jgi:hypothetical protein